MAAGWYKNVEHTQVVAQMTAISRAIIIFSLFLSVFASFSLGWLFIRGVSHYRAIRPVVPGQSFCFIFIIFASLPSKKDTQTFTIDAAINKQTRMKPLHTQPHTHTLTHTPSSVSLIGAGLSGGRH